MPMKKSERTRQLIVEKAAPIFNSKGVAGTSISDIMEATQLAKGGVYGNFSTKDEILIAAFDHIAENLKAKLAGITAPVPTFRGKFEALFDFYIDNATQPFMDGGCPILNFGADADDTHPELRDRVSELIAYFQNRIVQLVNAGKAGGEFQEDWNAEYFAVKMFTMLEGAVLVCRMHNSNKQMKAVVSMLKDEMEHYTI
ncbi:TetR/AcrR family transcriptional regulator [Chitinophaga agrisoli]|uniref:TetR/AcrR family transcriptional regulator n=2 Tax=Chitinophaga agrisoli TaxID=2607653 RepID=A0A5B2VVC8_9BACT|nr:TetR/AcrR family transcriptional regulator [Chitinophaga agrisoli]